jgi:uncharacterized protein (DUF433 family)
MKAWKDHIVSDKNILLGKPTIKGTRISLELIIERLADGWTIDDLLSSYPTLKIEDFEDSLKHIISYDN